MLKYIKVLIYIFIFTGLLILQQVESIRKAYELRKYSFELSKLEENNTKLLFRLKELKSSKKLIEFANANKFVYPKADEIIYIRLCQNQKR